LRSVPGVKDEVSITDGKRIQIVDTHIFDGTEAWQLLNTYTNTYRFGLDNITWLANALMASQGKGNLINKGYSLPYNYITDDTEHFYIENSMGNNLIRVFVNQSTINAQAGATTIDKFKNWFAGAILNYQLVEPLETPIQISGTLLCYPSGTVYAEPIVADAGMYTNKMTVLNQSFPIKRLDRLSVVDFLTGMETELNTSQAVVAGDGLSFTHPDLTAGNIVFFEYEHFYDGTQPEVSATYYDSRYVLKDSVTGKFYKVVPSVANGVLTNGLVEV
jgi:hypothetical protein